MRNVLWALVATLVAVAAQAQWDCSCGCSPGYVPPPCTNEGSTDACGCCLNYSPIIVNLAAGDLAFGNAANGVLFDINGYGRSIRVAWPTSGMAAWLVIDRDRNGHIDSGREMFGNTTRLSSGRLAHHGYQVLDELDDNRDGLIDEADAVFAHLRLWSDANHDGVSEDEELLTLKQAAITALSTQPRESQRRDIWGNMFTYRAQVFAATPPRVRFSYDVFPVGQNP